MIKQDPLTLYLTEEEEAAAAVKELSSTQHYD